MREGGVRFLHVNVGLSQVDEHVMTDVFREVLRQIGSLLRRFGRIALGVFEEMLIHAQEFFLPIKGEHPVCPICFSINKNYFMTIRMTVFFRANK